MNVLTIRKHSRFAVRHEVTLHGEDQRPYPGLLVEVSQGGCRVALPGSRTFAAEQPVTVRIPGFGGLRGSVSWTKDGFVGIHFVFVLHHDELDDLIGTCRAAPGTGERAFGT